MIVPLHAANPGVFTGAGNWTYLLTGAVPVLIDAGVGRPAHLDAIAAHVPDGPAHVLVTHGHPDHASGAPALAERWPAIRFWKFLDPSADSPSGVSWNALSDDQVVSAGDDSLTVVFTPGHASDHVCFWHAPSRTLFGGDLVVRGSSVVIPASHGGSLADYLHSLKRVLAINPGRILPAHGPAIDDPAAVIKGYVDHRLARERQVLDAIEAGLQTVEAITARIYVDLAPELLPMARESVLAHLQKLEHDGLVTRRGDEWRSQS